MDKSTETAWRVAGFLAAEVMWPLTREPEADFVPMAFVTDVEGQRFRFFEGSTLEAMIEDARKVLPEAGHASWTLAYEGFVTRNGARTPAIFVQSWVTRMESPILIAQPWRRGADGRAEFEGKALTLPAGAEPTAFVTKYFDPVELTTDQAESFEAGVASNVSAHEKGVL